MMYRVAAVLSLCLTMAPALSMRKVARIPSGPHGTIQGRVVCCDSDHDSLPEMIYCTGSILQQSWNPTRVEVREHVGWNRFRLVYADTADSELFRWPWWPSRIRLGNAEPLAAGDIDGDGLTDLLCMTCHYDTLCDTLFLDVITVESPDASSYPCSLTWNYPYMRNQAPQVTPAFYLPDLNGDGHRRILVTGTWVWENEGNDSNELVWCREVGFGACGDFSMDGRWELAGGELLSVWEYTGDERQYEEVYRDTAYGPGGVGDMFTTNDVRNGRPALFRTYYSGWKLWLGMYQDESGGHRFTQTMVDSLRFGKQDVYVQSACGDIDGDGIDECVWTTPESVRVYKAFGNNDLRKVWELQLDPGPVNVNTWTTTIYDVNGDGYNEWMLACDSISIFEVDAVDLLSPNGGSCSVGDTVPIRWAVNTPPCCDSLSLFLRRDSLWHLSTIAAGLPGTDTLYRWVVPSGVPETARVVVIAYGPGWQFDMSDSVISFIGGGVAEGTSRVYVTRLRDCSPNPLGRATTVSYEIARGGRVALSVHDVSGRLVRRLEDGFRSAGPNSVAWNGTDSRGMAVPAGVYFVCFSANGVTQSRRVTLVR